MADINPYEPPREPETLTTGKVVKRSIGVGVILILTPLAAFVTFFVSCLVAISTTNPIILTPQPPGTPQPSEAVFWAMTLIPSSLATAAMLVWAIRIRRRRLIAQDQAQQKV